MSKSYNIGKRTKSFFWFCALLLLSKGYFLAEAEKSILRTIYALYLLLL